MSRILVSVQRRVDRTQLSRYDTAWSAFREAAVARGAKAWRFRSAEEEGLYLEFLEFRVEADPRADQEMKGALSGLEGVAEGSFEEWLDANIQ